MDSSTQPTASSQTCCSLFSIENPKQTAKNIVYALAIIAAIGCAISGVLALQNVAFFGGIETTPAYVLLYGGVGSFIALIIGRALVDCLSDSPEDTHITPLEKHLILPPETKAGLTDEEFQSVYNTLKKVSTKLNQVKVEQIDLKLLNQAQKLLEEPILVNRIKHLSAFKLKEEKKQQTPLSPTTDRETKLLNTYRFQLARCQSLSEYAKNQPKALDDSSLPIDSNQMEKIRPMDGDGTIWVPPLGDCLFHSFVVLHNIQNGKTEYPVEEAMLARSNAIKWIREHLDSNDEELQRLLLQSMFEHYENVAHRLEEQFTTKIFKLTDGNTDGKDINATFTSLETEFNKERDQIKNHILEPLQTAISEKDSQKKLEMWNHLKSSLVIDYLNDVECPRIFAGAAEMYALCKIYNVKGIVYQEGGHEEEFNNTCQSGAVFHFWQELAHYKPIHPDYYTS